MPLQYEQSQLLFNSSLQSNACNVADHRFSLLQSFTFNDSAHGARLFGLKEFGNIYSRIMNVCDMPFRGIMTLFFY
jgi:O-acetylhomoserine/O-acetylserine sulfhydrylase-like pyridoxal-dependent enzyme